MTINYIGELLIVNQYSLIILFIVNSKKIELCRKIRNSHIQLCYKIMCNVLQFHLCNRRQNVDTGMQAESAFHKCKYWTQVNSFGDVLFLCFGLFSRCKYEDRKNNVISYTGGCIITTRQEHFSCTTVLFLVLVTRTLR